jgi:hypothetical protein
MMLKAEYSTRTFRDKLAQLKLNIQNMPTQFDNAMKGKEGQFANQALRQLTIVPGAPVRPIRWKSQRQKRAYFASKGFGKGIPSRRTYAVLKGWKVTYKRDGDGGSVSLINTEPHMRFVQGDDAQPFHLDTGWVQRKDVVDDFVREVNGQVTAVWYGVCDATIKVEKR